MSSHFSRTAVAVAVALFAFGEAHAARPAHSKTAGAVTPKIGAVASADANALAQSLAGAGVTITNAAFTGAPEAVGSFSQGASGVGIATGVVLSTGRVADAAGPNQRTDNGTNFEGPGDSALDALVTPASTHDAAVLSFDLTTAQSTIAISYVFASEEYDEFTGSTFNDAVGIFVNGANCANVSGRPVAVNTVNAGLNASLYVSNADKSRDTEFDGMTTVLTCVAAVTPGAVNRVRIAVADTSDGALDSAIFVGAGGIVAPAAAAPTVTYVTKAFEYFHAAFNHYFVTAIPDELANLDNGAFEGWQRTGQTFHVYTTSAPAAAPVCRFFSTSFDPKSSHFYTADAAECATVKANANWQFEGEVFGVAQASAAGECAAGRIPLYRLYNDGEGSAPNHRYTTDTNVWSLMVANGWIPEGSGVGVVACVPQ